MKDMNNFEKINVSLDTRALVFGVVHPTDHFASTTTTATLETRRQAIYEKVRSTAAHVGRRGQVTDVYLPIQPSCSDLLPTSPPDRLSRLPAFRRTSASKSSASLLSSPTSKCSCSLDHALGVSHLEFEKRALSLPYRPLAWSYRDLCAAKKVKRHARNSW